MLGYRGLGLNTTTMEINTIKKGTENTRMVIHCLKAM